MKKGLSENSSYLAAAVAVSLPFVAHAQDVAGASQSGQSASGAGEIVVTAQRRSERLQDVPITLTAINSEQLERNNARSLADVAKLTPAVRIDYQGSFAQPTIRGVGTAFVATGTGSNVGIYNKQPVLPEDRRRDLQFQRPQSVRYRREQLQKRRPR